MTMLKLGRILDEKTTKIAVELPAAVHRDLQAYAVALARETGEAIETTQLVAPMLARFMASDRGFARLRKSRVASKPAPLIAVADAPPPGREPNSGTS